MTTNTFFGGKESRVKNVCRGVDKVQTWGDMHGRNVSVPVITGARKHFGLFCVDFTVVNLLGFFPVISLKGQCHPL
jgi:hypothetical protein